PLRSPMGQQATATSITSSARTPAREARQGRAPCLHVGRENDLHSTKTRLSRNVIKASRSNRSMLALSRRSLILLYLEKNGVDARVRLRIEAKALIGRLADTHGHQRNGHLILEIAALDESFQRLGHVERDRRTKVPV